MWIQFSLLLGFCVLFLFSGGFFSKAGAFLSSHFPSFLSIKPKHIRQALLIVFCCNLLGLALSAWEQRANNTLSDLSLKRPAQGSEPVEEELVVSDGTNQEEILVKVNEVPYSDEELVSILEAALDEMDQTILGKNHSLDKIEYPLNLISTISDTPIQVTWFIDKPMYLDWEGNLSEDIPAEGVEVELRAELTADDYLREYLRKIHVYPERLSSSEGFLRDVQREVQRLEDQGEEYQYLPQEINGRPLSWSMPKSNTGLIITGLSLLTALLLLLRDKEQDRKKAETDLTQLRLAYPNLVNKLILFMQAGISSRRAIRKISMDYKFRLDHGEQPQKAYDEVLRIYYEMEQGVPEEEAYEHLGQRCPLLEYRTLSTLLIQNLKKGSSQFLTALHKECAQAFEERKKQALILGEEAGTKLLLPMGIMLLIVLLILMVPALMTF